MGDPWPEWRTASLVPSADVTVVSGISPPGYGASLERIVMAAGAAQAGARLPTARRVRERQSVRSVRTAPGAESRIGRGNDTPAFSRLSEGAAERRGGGDRTGSARPGGRGPRAR